MISGNFWKSIIRHRLPTAEPIMPSESLSDLTKDQLLSLYRTMVLIRQCEEQLARSHQRGLIHGACHTYVGQEAIAAGVCAILQQDDVVFSTHRGHGHALAKGVAPRQLIAELFGRATGCSHGRGGSMHLFAPEVGMMGTSGIVGPCILQAAGAGYSFKLLEDRSRGRRLLRRRGRQQRRLSRRAEPGQHLEAAGAVRLRKQPVRHRSAVRLRGRQPERRPAAARATACPGSNSTATTCWPSTRPPARPSTARERRRADADRVPHLPHPAARRRDGRFHLSHARRGRGMEDPLPDRAAPRRDRRSKARDADELDAIDAEIDDDRRRRPAVRRGEPLARPGDGRRSRLREATVASRRRRSSPTSPAPAGTREITYMQATLEALAEEMAANPRDLRDGRRDRQARRQLQDHDRAVRPVRPGAAVRHADLRTRLRRPRLRRGHDRHAAGDRLHVRRLRPRLPSAKSSTRSPRCST